MYYAIFHPRRRSVFLKGLLVFIGLCLVLTWIKSGRTNTDSSLRKRDLSNHDEPGQNVLQNNKNINRDIFPEPKQENQLEENREEEVYDKRDDGVKANNFKNKNKIPLQIPKIKNEPAIDYPAVFSDVFNKQFDSVHEHALLSEIKVDAEKIEPGLGEGGKGVPIEGEEGKIADAIVKKESFNVLASDKISLTRSVPDYRMTECKSLIYDKDLPSASVIIIFTNEVLSALLRTVHSVIKETPDEFVQEIILVDDFSDRDELHDKLEVYIRHKFTPKVKLLRATERLGLIKARLAGAQAATGEVIIFLDSHCECAKDWIQPLLQRIKDNRKAVLVPLIDVIDEKSLKYMGGDTRFFQIGGFTWSGHFTWIFVPEIENRNWTAPVSSPTMAGGLFAINRKYFWEIGGYDDGMEVWGGENLELSFRTWMCGGVLETMPCSRVGHIFRSFHPYTFPGNKDTHGINTARMAEVWMDEYKRLFYYHRSDLKKLEIGDITERQQLRKNLNCKSFKWFLDNVFPQKFIPDENVIAYGKVRNPDSKLCFDTLQKDEKKLFHIGLYGCHDFVAMGQFFSLSDTHQLRREEVCAQASNSNDMPETVEMVRCEPNEERQKWHHEKGGPIIHKASKRCLDKMSSQSMDDVYVNECSGDDSQVWEFDTYVPQK